MKNRKTFKIFLLIAALLISDTSKADLSFLDNLISVPIRQLHTASKALPIESPETKKEAAIALPVIAETPTVILDEQPDLAINLVITEQQSEDPLVGAIPEETSIQKEPAITLPVITETSPVILGEQADLTINLVITEQQSEDPLVSSIQEETSIQNVLAEVATNQTPEQVIDAVLEIGPENLPVVPVEKPTIPTEEKVVAINPIIAQPEPAKKTIVQKAISFLGNSQNIENRSINILIGLAFLGLAGKHHLDHFFDQIDSPNKIGTGIAREFLTTAAVTFFHELGHAGASYALTHNPYPAQIRLGSHGSSKEIAITSNFFIAGADPCAGATKCSIPGGDSLSARIKGAFIFLAGPLAGYLTSTGIKIAQGISPLKFSMQDALQVENLLPLNPFLSSGSSEKSSSIIYSDGFFAIKALCKETPAFIKNTVTQGVLLLLRCALPALMMCQQASGLSCSRETAYAILGFGLINSGCNGHFAFNLASSH